MKRLTLIGSLGTALLAGGLVAAQTPAKPDDHAAHHPAAAGDKGAGKTAPGGKPAAGEMGKGEMGKGGMGKGGMMGEGHDKGMMGGGMQMCSMMEGNAKVEVTKQPKGVTITMTSDDAAVVTRLQKRAEAMKLMHEANAHQ